MALGVHDADEIERALTAFAAERNGGVIVTPHAVTFTNRDLIVALAARLRLPALYPLAFYVKAGGLISYGFDPVTSFSRGQDMLTEYCAAPSLPTCRCSTRRNSSSSSISRPPKHSASPSRNRSCCAPTR